MFFNAFISCCGFFCATYTSPALNFLSATWVIVSQSPSSVFVRFGARKDTVFQRIDAVPSSGLILDEFVKTLCGRYSVHGGACLSFLEDGLLAEPPSRVYPGSRFQFMPACVFALLVCSITRCFLNENTIVVFRF